MMVTAVPLKNILEGAVPNVSSRSMRNVSNLSSVLSCSRGNWTDTLADGRRSENGKAKREMAGLTT